MADKVLFRLLTVTDYEEEERFLREEHKKGWKLRRYILPGFYVFDKCRPEDVVYRLDFEQAGKEDRPGYLQLYRDYGWEYFLTVNGFSYFRKPADFVDTEEETEIFSDNASKLDMIMKVFKWKMVPLMVVFLCCLLPQLVMQYSRWREGDPDGKLFTVIFFILFLVYVVLFIHCGRGILRLRKKYNNR